MIWILLATVFILGIIPASMFTLRWRMEGNVCERGCSRSDYCLHGYKARGDVRERNNEDYAAALGMALFWPLILTALTLYWTGFGLFLAFSAPLKRAPLSRSEHKRVNRESERNAEALAKEFNLPFREIAIEQPDPKAKPERELPSFSFSDYYFPDY